MNTTERNVLRERLLAMAERQRTTVDATNGYERCVAHGRVLGYGADCRECFDALAAVALANTAGSTLTGDPHSLDALATEIAAWQRATFPHATPESVAAHLHRESLELLMTPASEDEIADLFHLVVGAAQACGYDLGAIVRAKLETNRARRWGEPDAQGVVEHLK